MISRLAERSGGYGGKGAQMFYGFGDYAQNVVYVSVCYGF